MNIFQIIRDNLEAGGRGVLATVIRRSGSAPRDVGAKMYIDETGRSFGTVGGGLLERYVQEEAAGKKNDDRASIFHMKMDSRTVAEQGMLCGGNVDVLLEPVRQAHRPLYARLAELGEKGGRAVVVTALATEAFAKTLVEEGLMITGDPVDENSAAGYLDLFGERRPVVVGEGRFVVEPLFDRTRLYVFGAGHVSQYIARIADMVDFNVVVIDDREEYANTERFPEAGEIMVQNFVEAFDSLSFTGQEFIVIVTRGHSHDAEVLRAALSRNTRYVGMIGSRRKVQMIFDLMRQSGYSDEVISRVHAPIGLSIHAETPQEIAVSIVGELIQVRAE
ncbi:MAG: putative xanthine dehydrogenase subunit A [Syntrophorhabdus sp. PtaB.Bin047]|jgi:xanthine dehydrogenase accessory factor|nr:MAG: putative xanthine dehydrogenase subunit A [Syntrophorhabdus sp. PtaB.Bin047]